MNDESAPAEGEWEDWAATAAADLGDPRFRELVADIDVDQQEWARQYAATLRALRKALRVTQAEVAQRIGATQPEVSKIERRDDVLVSTLRAVVGALGAELELVARFRDGHVVRIDLSDVA